MKRVRWYLNAVYKETLWRFSCSIGEGMLQSIRRILSVLSLKNIESISIGSPYPIYFVLYFVM
jgi:hypothetical protein